MRLTFCFMSEYTGILQKYWGYPSFRPLQEEIILSVAEGNDTLGLMPTGGGKSITFQVYSLSTEGICLVITPLIALMKDQVENLKKRGIKALAVYSGMTREEMKVTLDNATWGDYKFLYLSPERVSTESFRERLKNMKINLIAVDEAHCISQWGYDFRPSYLKIAELRALLPGVKVMALTATATEKVVDDIQDKLLFGSGFPYAKPDACIEMLLGFNKMLINTNLPQVPREKLRSIVERDTLTLLGLR